MKAIKIVLCFIALFASLVTYANFQINTSVIRQLLKKAPVSSATICRDLVGHKLSEGTDNGYHSRDWYWTIEEGEIKAFRILSVRENTSNRYTIDAQMRLARHTGSAYNAKATIYYVKTRRGWEIEFVKSLSMNIVRTHRYDDCIHVEKGSGILNQDDLYVTNNCEVALDVGGKICQIYGGWKKFSIRILPHETKLIDYCVADYTIDYVERP